MTRVRTYFPLFLKITLKLVLGRTYIPLLSNMYTELLPFLMNNGTNVHFLRDSGNLGVTIDEHGQHLGSIIIYRDKQMWLYSSEVGRVSFFHDLLFSVVK